MGSVLVVRESKKVQQQRKYLKEDA